MPARSSTESVAPKNAVQGAGRKVVFEAVEDTKANQPRIAFVNVTGQGKNSAKVQRSIRQHVMHNFGHSKRTKNIGCKAELLPAPATTSEVGLLSVPMKCVKNGRALPIILPKSTSFSHSSGSSTPVRSRLSTPSADRFRFIHCDYNSSSSSDEFSTSTTTSSTAASLNSPEQEQDDELIEEISCGTLDNAPECCEPQILTTRHLSRFNTGRIDPFLPYPIALTPRVRRLLDYIFNDQTHPTDISMYRSALLPLGLNGGPAAFHQILSNMALYLQKVYPKREGDDGLSEYQKREELIHQAWTLKRVNRLMTERKMGEGQTKAVTGYEAISAVAALVCYAHMASDMQLWHTHMSGLKELVRRRGGISTTDNNPALRIALCWVDVNGSCSLDLRPAWPLPESYVPLYPPLPSSSTSSSRQPIEATPTAQAIARTLLATFLSSPVAEDSRPISYPKVQHYKLTQQALNTAQELTCLFLDTALVIAHLNAEERHTAGAVYRNSTFMTVFINALNWRLLSVRPLEGEASERGGLEREAIKGARIGEALRLTLICSLAAVRRRFGLCCLSCAVQVKKLRHVLDDGSDDFGGQMGVDEWAGLEALRLWVVAIGVLEAEEEGDVMWMEDEWRRLCMKQGLMTLEEMEMALKSVIWVESIHGRCFWELKERFGGEDKVIYGNAVWNGF